MFLDRYLALLCGIAGAIVTSQLPGFTLQYMQNLNGRLDELEPIVDEFEADVLVYNYTLEEALEECIFATGLFDALCESFEDIVFRYEELLHHYEELSEASDYRRPFVLMKSSRQEIIASVWEEFEPAVPVSNHGLVYTGCGFFTFFAGLSILLHIVSYLCCCFSNSGRMRATKKSDLGKMQVAVTGFERSSSNMTKSDIL